MVSATVAFAPTVALVDAAASKSPGAAAVRRRSAKPAPARRRSAAATGASWASGRRNLRAQWSRGNPSPECVSRRAASAGRRACARTRTAYRSERVSLEAQARCRRARSAAWAPPRLSFQPVAQACRRGRVRRRSACAGPLVCLRRSDRAGAPTPPRHRRTAGVDRRQCPGTIERAGCAGRCAAHRAAASAQARRCGARDRRASSSRPSRPSVPDRFGANFSACAYASSASA